MSKTNELDELNSLSINELGHILNHLKLGYPHLKELLEPQELNRLLEKIKIAPERKKTLKSNLQEKLGQIAIYVNTGITGCLGTWLGISAFGNYQLNSTITLLVILMSPILGAVCGYLAYKVTANRSIKTMREHKILLLSHKIQEIILAKREEICHQIENDIETISGDLFFYNKKKQDYFLEDARLIKRKVLESQRDINIFLKNFKDSKIKSQYKMGANYLFKSIIKNLKLLFKKQETGLSHLEICHEGMGLKKLRKSCHIENIKNKKFTYWVKNNFLEILIGLIPTALGAFGSFFVFLNGIPDIYRQFDFHFFNENKFIYYKGMSFMLIWAATIYFSYSFMHFNYTEYKRSLLLEKSEHKIYQDNIKINKQLSRQNVLGRIKSSLHQLSHILLSVRFINSFIKQVNDEEMHNR